MFITAVCVLFLMKLRWPKNKSSYSRFFPKPVLTLASSKTNLHVHLPSVHAAINCNIREILHNFDTEIIAMAFIKQLRLALGIYFHDPGFDENIVRYSEKRKLY